MRLDLGTPSAGQPDRVPRRALPLAWAILGLIASISVGVFIAALPARYTQALNACTGSACGTQALYLVALDGITALTWTILAVVIFVRRPGDRIGLLSALTFITFGVARFPDAPLALAANHAEWALGVESLRFLGSACLSVYIFVFPDGHFHFPLARWIVAGWIAIQIPEFFAASSLASEAQWPVWLRFVGFLGFVTLVIASQIWRYRYISTPSQRRQTRWATLGLSLALTCYLTLAFGYPVLLAARLTPVTLSPIASSTLLSLTFLLAPVSVAYSMMRNQLFDVDILINRALVYGLTTLGVGSLYIGCVAGLQTISGVIIGGATSPLIIVVSTLLIAAVFQPIRRALQRTVDRHFYRRKYDADATLGAFAASLRHDIDLVDLRRQLLDIAHETMQPTHASLWLRPPARDNARSQA